MNELLLQVTIFILLVLNIACTCANRGILGELREKINKLIARKENK